MNAVVSAPPRDIVDIIAKMRTHVPVTEPFLHAEMEKISTWAEHRAPEDHAQLWRRLSLICSNSLRPPLSKWECEVVALLRNVPVFQVHREHGLRRRYTRGQ